MGSRTGHQTDGGCGEGWGDYMQEKRRKLTEQFTETNPKSSKSSIFEGISIYVNGYTDPSSDVLRRLVLEHGGVYHTYYSLTGTTHIVAVNLPQSKIEQLRYNDKVVRPDWITESVLRGRLLDDNDYLVYKPAQKNSSSIDKYVKKLADPSKDSESNKTNAARSRDIPKTTDPTFLGEFYGRSRLHHISTWGQQLKTLVQRLREDNNDDNFPGRERIAAAMSPADKIGHREKVIMHIDMDCFFVSVGLLKHPQLRGKPVAVTHSQGKSSNREFCSRAEIASCSYEARAFGVKGGTYFGGALKLCPQLQSIPYDFESYHRVSTTLYTILASYTSDLEAVSCDELYVDMTDLCCQLQVDPLFATNIIRDQIKSETGCPCSAGLGPNMLVARLATKKAKPDGQFRILTNEVQEFMRTQKVSDLPGVGYRTEERLAQMEIESCDQLANFPFARLSAEFGPKTAKNLQAAAIGQDSRTLSYNSVRKSVSCDVNYAIRMKEKSELDKFLVDLCDEVVKRLQECNMKAKTITLKLLIRAAGAPLEPDKYMGHGLCDSITKSTTLTCATDNPAVIAREVIALATAVKPCITDIRGIGISLHKLEPTSSTAQYEGEGSRSKQITDFMKAVPENNVPSRPVVKMVQQPSMAKPDLLEPQPSTSTAHSNFEVDLEVLKELPKELQLEIQNEYGLNRPRHVNHFSSPVPDSVDPEVWKNLPDSIKKELIQNMKNEAKNRNESPKKVTAKSPRKKINCKKSPKKIVQDQEATSSLTLSMIWNPRNESDDSNDSCSIQQETYTEIKAKPQLLGYDEIKAMAKEIVKQEIESETDENWVCFTCHVEAAIKDGDLETGQYILRLLHSNAYVQSSVKWQQIFNNFKTRVLDCVRSVFGFTIAQSKLPPNFVSHC